MALAPDDLRKFIRHCGTELAKQQLECLEKGPYHDLPDSDMARQAADYVVEMDSLVLAGRQGEATRRFRELTGGIWDQAVEKLQYWTSLKRSEKLACFGWRVADSRKAPPFNGSDDPMRDPWLDGETSLRAPDR
jgi:hypothetical protein